VAEGYARFDGTGWHPDPLPSSLPWVSTGGILADGADLWLNLLGEDWSHRDVRNGSRNVRSFRRRADNDAPQTRVIRWTREVGYPGTTVLAWEGLDRWDDTPPDQLQFSWRLDGGPWTPFSSQVSHVFATLESGRHTFEVRATDLAGNVDATPDALTWTVLGPDTTAPQTLLDGDPPTPTTSTSATIAFSATEPGSSFECSLNGAPFADCTSPVELSGLAVGVQTFQVQATDVAGNTDPTPLSISWTVEALDTTAPEASITDAPAPTTTDTTAAFTYSSDERR